MKHWEWIYYRFVTPTIDLNRIVRHQKIPTPSTKDRSPPGHLYLDMEEISLRSPRLPSVTFPAEVACVKPWGSPPSGVPAAWYPPGYSSGHCSPLQSCSISLEAAGTAPASGGGGGGMQGAVSMPLSVDAPLMYVRPRESGSIGSPDPKRLSSLLPLEALLERVLLLEWLEHPLSPDWKGR